MLSMLCTYFAVMATDFPTRSHSQPSDGGCPSRIYILHVLVLVVGGNYGPGVFVVLVDSTRVGVRRAWN